MNEKKKNEIIHSSAAEYLTFVAFLRVRAMQAMKCAMRMKTSG